jgi:probable addiction module antidote protein
MKQMTEKLSTYDPAEDLASDAAIATFMAEAFETEDVGYIAHALGVVARAKGMAEIAIQTGLSREQLYRSFSENGNPTLKTTIAVMKALGIELTTKVHA